MIYSPTLKQLLNSTICTNLHLWECLRFIKGNQSTNKQAPVVLLMKNWNQHPITVYCRCKCTQWDIQPLTSNRVRHFQKLHQFSRTHGISWSLDIYTSDLHWGRRLFGIEIERWSTHWILRFNEASARLQVFVMASTDEWRKQAWQLHLQWDRNKLNSRTRCKATVLMHNHNIHYTSVKPCSRCHKYFA